MKCNSTYQRFVPILATIGLLVTGSSLRAVPYACDVTNSSGVVSFRLNENADNVKVISSGGTVTNDIGAGLKGVTITNLGVAAGTVKIMVTRSAPTGYTLTTSDSLQDGNGVYVNKFEQPRGIAVNKKPSSPAFGRIYISNGQVGTTAASPGPVRQTFDGIYMINSDDTVALDTGVNPRTGGIPFDTANAVSPFKVTIGKDDGLVYISDDSDTKGGLWVCDPDITTGTNVFDTVGDFHFGATNHGSIYSAVVEGSLANNNLKIFTMDEDLTPVISAWRYDINSGPLPYTGPTNFLHTPDFNNTAIKLVRGGVSNYLYVSENRSAGTDKTSISIFTENGVFITNSLAYTRSNFAANAADIFRNTTAIDISPDGTTLALLRGSAFGSVLLVPITNGILNVAGTNSFSIGVNGSSDNNRDIAYDIAGNLYIVNTATEWFRIFSKGGASVAITGTDGTFVLGVPPTIVSVVASTPTANEQGPVNGVFTISRTGDTSTPLTVNYTVGGTATAVSDYTTLSGSVIFQAGAASTNITVAVVNDSVTELTETVILTITGSGSYGVSGGSATVSILDNEPTEVSLTSVKTDTRLLEGFSDAKVGLQLTRRGLIGPALTVNLSYGGAATLGVDYNAPSSVAIGASTATATFNLTSIDDDAYEGDEALIVSVASGSGYAIGTTNSVTATVVDDDYAPGAVLFSDNFETDSSVNWVVNANDFFADSSATFGYDYSQKFVPPVPGGSSTKGLLFRLNELTGAPVNAISASPLNVTLPDQYHMRFKMWINYNGPMLDGGSGSTLHLTTGVGTNPDHANAATFGGSDGIWFGVDGDGGSTTAAGDADAYVAINLQPDDSGVYAAGTTNSPRSTTTPYYALWGGLAAPAAQLAAFPGQTGTSQAGNMGISWHTVVVTKTTNTVAWAIDGLPIATVPADATPLGSSVFVGYQDIFAGAAGVTNVSFALVENFRIEAFATTPITITNVKVVGGNVEVSFSASAALLPAAFKLQSSASVSGTYLDDNSANIVSTGTGTFKATTALNGSVNFYRIKN